jgi:UrcA family protein
MIASASTFSRTLAAATGSLLFAGLCIAGAAAPAAAKQAVSINEDGKRVVQISYADLDLGTKAGRATLNSRIRIAARKVCSDTSSDPWASARQHQCVMQAMEQTRHATLAARANGRIGD